jgi:flotillin
VLNGADGLSEIAAGLVSQGLTILDSVRKGLPSQPQGGTDNGRVLGQLTSDSPGSAGVPGGEPRG